MADYKGPYEQLGGKAKLLYDAAEAYSKKQRKEQMRNFDYSQLTAHEMPLEEYQYHVEQHNKKLAEEKQLELPLWDVGEPGITYIDYKFTRKGEHVYLDPELTLDNLRGYREGDTFTLKESVLDNQLMLFRTGNVYDTESDNAD